MTLPATWKQANEVEALAFAREWIARAWAPDGPFHPGTSRVPMMMREFALAHPFGADEIAYLADNGSVEADTVLREIIAERIDRGEHLGAVFGAYNIHQLNRTPKLPGPTKACNFMRDIGIAMLVTALMDRFGLRPTRNTDAKRTSASSVAAQALTEAGIGLLLTHKNVERIWNRYLPAFAHTKFAAGTRFAVGWPAGYDRGLLG